MRCFDWVYAHRYLSKHQKLELSSTLEGRECRWSNIFIRKKLSLYLRVFQTIYGSDTITAIYYEFLLQSWKIVFWPKMTIIVPKSSEINILSKKLDARIKFFSKKLKFTISIKNGIDRLYMFLHQPNFMGIFTILANLFAENIWRDINFCGIFLCVLLAVGL